MPFGTITATESTFGSISGSIVGAVPGTLSGSVGVPGPQGEQGIQGIQGPPGPAGPGSTWGGIAGTLSAQTDLQTALDGKYSTSNPSGFITSAALSGYAPLASPLFTGDPRGPTAALGDNDTSLATTAFVQQELLSGTANARNLEVYVRNQTGSTIPAASIVYINGATGNRPTITRAQANNDANSAQTFGFTKAAIANNGFGFVIVRGELENVDTSALTEGVQLYLSPTVAGAYTTTKPSAPQHLVYVGICVRAHPTQGVILVAVQNGYELPELHDVKITSPTNGQVLKYDSAQSLWVNGTDSAGVAWGGITGTLTSQTDLATALNAKLELSGGVLTVNSTIQASTATTSSLFAGDVFGVELSADPSENASLQYNGLLVQNAIGTMSVTPSGLTFPNSSTQTVAYPGSSGFLLKADNLAGLADTSVSRTNLGLGTMATATAADYSTTTVANGLYYPLSGNPSSFLVAADIAGKAPLASPDFTGNVTINSSTGSALFITQTGTGNILTLHDQASDTTFVAIDANGKVSTIASETTNGAGFNIAHGVAPTTPVNGDIWTTTAGLFMRQNGTTKQYVDFDTSQTINGNKTFSNATQTLGNSTATGTISVASGATISASTKTVNIGTGGVVGSTTNITVGPVLGASTTSIGNTTAASTLNLATGATLTGTTKAVNIGTAGVAGSTTNITIGSTTGTSTTTLQGATNGVTQTAGNSTTLLATTAFVTTADNLKANLASPTFTGTPSAPTATAGTNITQIATTAFVTAAVPAAATVAEAKLGSDTTKFISSNVLQKVVNSPSYYKFPRGLFSTNVSGTGATVTQGALIAALAGPSTGAGGSILRYYGVGGVDVVSGTGWSVGTTYDINFGKAFRLTGSTRLAVSTNTIVRVSFGKQANNGVGDPNSAAVGWRYNQAVGFIEIIAHDGATLKTLTTSSNPSGWFEWEIFNDGAGNVQMFVNDVSIGTRTGGRTTFSYASGPDYVEEIETTATPAAQPSAFFRNGGVFLQP